MRPTSWGPREVPMAVPPKVWNQALVAVGNAVNALDAVAVIRLQDDGADDIIEPRAEAAAGDNGRNGGAGVEVDFPARSRRFETQRLGVLFECFPQAGQSVIHQHASIVTVERVGTAFGKMLFERGNDRTDPK
jgi:hypothetical protein